MFSKGAESRFCLAGCYFLCISVSLNTFAHTLRGVLAFEFFGMKTLKNPSVNASGHLFPKISVSMPNCLRSGFLVCAVREQWRVFLPCLTGSLTGECSLWKDKGDLCVYFYSRFYIDWRWNGQHLKIRIEKSSKVCFFPPHILHKACKYNVQEDTCCGFTGLLPALSSHGWSVGPHTDFALVKLPLKAYPAE